MRAIIFTLFYFAAITSSAQVQTFYVGTYTGTGSKGIYTYSFNTQTGEAQWLSNTDSGTVANPSFLALSPNGSHLYAVTETGGSDPGSVSAFNIHEKQGLQFLNKLPTGGDHPCYVAVHKSGNWAVAGNYNGGNVSLFSLNKDGSMKAAEQLLQHKGSGPNKDRQEKAHVHAAVFSPDFNYVFVPDLGMDKVGVYRFNPKGYSVMKAAVPPFVHAAPGSGPRHFTFHPNGKFAYLMEELGGTVSVYAYNSGKLRFLQRISSHPKGYKGALGSADIHVSEDGKFLYASNRGDANSIAVFSVGSNGLLKWVEAVPSGGEAPRNFAIAPGGRFVLAANQQTNNIVIFRRDAATGKLLPTGKQISIPKPVCIVFAK